MLALITLSVGGLLLLVALLMLLRHAFRTSMVWGILGLLFTIPLFIYAILRWDEVPIRKPVYISLVGLLSILVGVSGGALSQLTFLPENEVMAKIEDKIAPPEDIPLPNEEEAQAVHLADGENYDPLLTGGEFESVGIEDMSPPAAVIANNDPVPDYEVISVDEVGRAVNKRVKLILLSGEEIEGTLTHRQDESIVVESFVSGGALGYTYSIADIKLISVLGLEPLPEQELALEQDPASELQSLQEQVEEQSVSELESTLEVVEDQLEPVLEKATQ